MQDDGRPVTKPHRILPLRLFDAGGGAISALHVYCEQRHGAVPVAKCRTCTHCVAVRGAGEGEWVDCAPCTDDGERGATVAVGEALKKGVVGVRDDVLLRDVLALFAQGGYRTIVMVGVDGRVVGALREYDVERQLAQPGSESVQRALWRQVVAAEPATAAVTSILTVVDSAPLRDALLGMANAHQREVLVVTAQGEPLGLLTDVDALLAHAAVRRAEL